MLGAYVPLDLKIYCSRYRTSSFRSTGMQTSPTQLLGFVVVAVLVIDVFACSDIKIFLAPCDVTYSGGRRITKEQALDVQSEFLKREGFEAIADDAAGYFIFDLQAFEGKCEFPINRACSFLDCGCNEASGDISKIIRAEAKFSASSAKCFPEFGCDINSAEAEVGTPKPDFPGETLVVFCFGDKCTGFSLFSLAVAQTAFDECGMQPSDCTEIDLPPCEAEILTKCCSRASRICSCLTCSSRAWIWRRSEPLAYSATKDGKTCSCA